MNLLLLLAIWGCLTLQTESKKRKYGHPSHVNAAKRTKYNDEGLEPNLDMGTATTGPDDGDIISNYATENTPVFWRDVYEGRKKTHFKKTEEEGPPEGFELGADELPNTVGPSGNVYGGFPVNDMLGGFELPSPETLAILKAALKKYGPRNEYESHLHHDLENWAYGYEHHALPEYDVKETPPFYVTMLEGLKMAEENKKKPSCQQGGTCEPMLHLNDDQCNTLAGNCMPSKPVTQTSYEEPCPWKIIEMLFGCKKPAKPKPPMMTGKPDGMEPPPPKPDEPEKPPAEKPKKEKEKKPKAIPIQFEEGHATPEHVDKQVEDIKDEAKTAKDASKATQSDQPNAKLQSQLGLLGLLSKSASAKQEPQSRMDFTMPALNNSAAKDAADAKEVPSEVESTNVPVETSQPPNELKTEEKGDTEFSVWSDWSQCTVTCGKGSLSRARSCLHWKCDGKVIDIKECNKQDCPGYLAWSAWSACDAPCGTGREHRKRECSGIRCSGISKEERSCFRDPCKANLKLPPVLSNRLLASVGAPWGAWSDCTSKCGFGVQVRKRDCKQGNCQLNSNLVQTKTCLRQTSCSDEQKGMPKSVQQACLYIHNSYRLSHGARELTWADYLAEKAGQLAKELAQKSATNADARNVEAPGISVMVMPMGDTSDIGLEAACYTAAKTWYEEQKNYDYNAPHLSDDNKHFTQMIWKGSQEVGFGIALSKVGTNFYFVAKYDPPGNQDNYVGFRKNALPLQSENRLDDSTIEKKLG
eukprot:Seg3419.1 transcript_id=Seg3419.1/GoldUCD/mRNA.D3Y31 product=Ectin protein_id=Seg3419.1/GoldUCD/D3Y31